MEKRIVKSLLIVMSLLIFISATGISALADDGDYDFHDPTGEDDVCCVTEHYADDLESLDESGNEVDAIICGKCDMGALYEIHTYSPLWIVVEYRWCVVKQPALIVDEYQKRSVTVTRKCNRCGATFSGYTYYEYRTYCPR